MAGTLGPFDGTALIFYLGGTAVGHTTDVNFDISLAEINTTTKNSLGWEERIGGLRKWGFTGNGITAFDDANSILAILSALQSRTSVSVKFTTGVTGDIAWSGSGIFTKATVTGKMEAASTFTFTFAGSGSLTTATN